jgi:hypothetical protein
MLECGMRKLTLELTEEQRAELVHTRDRDARAYLRECAAAILKVADGLSAYQVAGSALNKQRQPETLYKWLHKYMSGGLQALIHKPRGHRGFSPSASRATRRTDPPTP